MQHLFSFLEPRLSVDDSLVPRPPALLVLGPPPVPPRPPYADGRRDGYGYAEADAHGDDNGVRAGAAGLFSFRGCEAGSLVGVSPPVGWFNGRLRGGDPGGSTLDEWEGLGWWTYTAVWRGVSGQGGEGEEG